MISLDPALPPPDAGGSPSYRSILLGVGVSLVFVLSLVFLFLFGPGIDVSGSIAVLLGAEPFILIPALLVHYLCFIFRGARWIILLRGVVPEYAIPGLLSSAHQVFTSWFVNSVTFFRLGDPFRAYLCRRKGGSFSAALGSLAAERFLDIVAFFSLMILSVSLLLLSSSWSGLWTFLWVSLSLSGVVALVFTVLLLSRGRSLGWLPVSVSRHVAQFHLGILSSLRNLPATSSLGFLGWAAEICRFYLVAQSLGIHLSFEMVIFLTLAGSLLSLFPTPGGLGAVEVGLAGLAVLVAGISVPQAAALVLADRAVNLLSVLFIGSLSFGVRPLWSWCSPVGRHRFFSVGSAHDPEDR